MQRVVMRGIISTDRLEYVDIAKGIGMLLVIFGHTVPYGDHWLFRIIYSFHMPLFFFLSGYTCRTEKYPDMKTCIKAKGKSLMIPYLYALLASIIVTMVIPIFRKDIEIKAFCRFLYSGYPEVFHNGALWFLPALFWACCGYVFLYGKLQIRRKNADLDILFIAVACMLLSKLYAKLMSAVVSFGTLQRLPWRMDSAFCGLFFVALGHCVSRNKSLLASHKKKIFFACAVIGAVSVYMNDFVNVNAGKYSNAFLFFTGVVSGCVCVLLLSMCINYNKALAYVGRNSLVYLCVQLLIIRVCLVCVNKASGTSWQYMGENTPLWLSIFLTVVCVAACTGIAEVIIRGKKK